ncbi:hypothetical protein PPM_p0202 (plasmid) [Paenibacillus polymyxa M1]|uniref:hypothetical protein n=1 Tax=Paenibacillus polymyxa TaxID=1406 RepID=UPI00021BBBB6|nr:hypothetical protein [Paenibacillus polymyxa]CCC86352.1 hypothetical protein PPM_p0202 [Paenibacillus polymyxa M1]
MGTQLSFSFNESLLITEQMDVATTVLDGNHIDPFVEANKKFFVDYTGVQLSLEFTNTSEEKYIKIKEISEILKTKQRYTLLFYDDLTGFPVATQLTMQKVFVAPASEYEEALHLTFRVKNQRRGTEVILNPNKTFIIWEGYINIDTNIWLESTRKDGFIRKMAKYGKVDECILNCGLKWADKKPFIVYRPVGQIF